MRQKLTAAQVGEIESRKDEELFKLRKENQELKLRLAKIVAEGAEVVSMAFRKLI